MKRNGWISTGSLLIVLGSMVPASAQRGEHHDRRNPPPIWIQQPAARGQHGSSRRQTEERRQPAAPRPYAQGRQGPPRIVWQEHRARHWQSEHRYWQDRGGYDGYRIPDDRFRSRFGPRHAFRIHRYPMTMMGGFINFQFGGFGFSILDPVPEYWSEGWYENDDVYIDDAGDGYYLRNRRHPLDRISISVNVR